jgi:cyanophycinase
MSVRRLAITWVLGLSMLLPLIGAATTSAATGYEYYAVGNTGDVTKATTAGLMLMGGGTDVDSAFQWMIGKAGGGDFVVIRASGTDSYYPYINGLGTLDSVETLIIKTRTAASNSFVVNKIRSAEAVFIAGGDQADYVDFWKGTPVEDAIHAVAARNAPIGGTSAGLAIMGEFSFAAQNGSVYSNEALSDPYNRYMTLDRDFLTLPNMDNIITDSHFVTRDRMGRLVGFLARIVQDGWSPEAKGIGIDERTAIVVEPNGAAAVRGSGAVYFLRTPGRPEVCASRTALTYRNVSVYRAAGAATFNLATWSGSGGTAYSISAGAGVLSSTQQGGNVY